MTASNLVPRYVWGIFESGREGEVAGAIDVPIAITGGNGDVGECDVRLFTKADSNHDAFFWVPVKAIVLGRISPVPSVIGAVLVVEFFKFGDGVVSFGKVVELRTALLVEIVVERESHFSNPRNELDPREKEPNKNGGDGEWDISIGEEIGD
jgi:hypothetical protein